MTVPKYFKTTLNIPFFRFLQLILVFGVLSLSDQTAKGQDHLRIESVEGLQHAGAVHFYAQPGELTVSIFKKDKKGGDPVNRIMSAILTGPDGSVCDSAKLYGAKDRQLKVTVKHAGIYTLLVSMNGDQYVQAVTWGFKTNALEYMINSGTGHADRKREEPIILNGSDQPFGIFFKPTKKSFSVKVTALPVDVKAVELYDGAGKLLRKLSVDGGKTETFVNFQEGSSEGIWELRLPHQKGTAYIEGITNDWDKDEKPLPMWTTSRKAYFDLGRYHWLLSPRRFARNVQKGDKGEIKFSLFNNSKSSISLQMSLADLPAIGKLSLQQENLEIAPGTSETVSVQYALSPTLLAGSYNFRLLAKDTQTGKQVFSLLELRVDSPKSVTLPIQLKLFEHDQFQFAYEPDYPRDNQFYFDVENRPWLVTDEGLKVLIAGTWETIKLPQGNKDVNYPTSTIGTDSNGFVYTIVSVDSNPYLMRVSTLDRRPELVPLPPGGHYKMETFMGGKVSKYPPVVLRYLLDTTKKSVSFWAKIHRLELFITSVSGGKLQVDAPILVSDNCVGISDHSGITNSVAADDDKLHLVWGETSDPAKNDPGVPTYTVTYDRKNSTLSNPIFLAYSPPVNDVHNMSTLLIDSKGKKHVIIGAHGRPFQYLTCPSGTEDWSKPIAISQLGQTYIGAILDAQNGIHLFCRTWRRGENFPGLFDASLFYQHKNENNVWEEQKPFALPALPGYSVYYHRLTVDRTGRSYLSMDYWSTWSAYRESYRDADRSRKEGKNRIVFTSKDGKDWQVVTKPNLESGIEK